MRGLTRVKQINNLVIYKRDDGNFIVVNPKEKDKKKSILCLSPNLVDIESFCKQRTDFVTLRGHNVHVGDIVVMCKTNQLGKIVRDHNDKNKWRFLPVNYGRYYTNQLLEITAKDVRPANYDERVMYLKKEFSCGTILRVHEIGEYLIFEYIEDTDFVKNGKKAQHLFAAYVDLQDLHNIYHTLDQAIVGCIAYKHTNDTMAGYYLFKLLRE